MVPAPQLGRPGGIMFIGRSTKGCDPHSQLRMDSYFFKLQHLIADIVVFILGGLNSDVIPKIWINQILKL